MIKIAIVGAGKGGSALLELFKDSPEVRVAAISDANKDAPGAAIAKGLGIPFVDNTKGLSAYGPEIVVNATGNADFSPVIKTAFPYRVEVIEGKGARLLWDLVDGQKRLKHDLSVLYDTGIILSKSKNLGDVLNAVLTNAMELTDSEAGTIALVKDGLMTVALRSGPGAAACFKNESKSWRPDDDPLTSFITSQLEPVEFPDIANDALFKGAAIAMEGVCSALAVTLRVNGDVLGILCVDDRKKRVFTDRHKDLIKLFSSQAAYAIEKFKLMHEVGESLTKLEGVFDDSGDMIIVADTDGRILKFSKGGTRILGYSHHEVVGRNVEEFYADREERRKIVKTVKEKGAVHNREAVLLKKDGNPVDISLTISQFKDASGAVIGTVGVSKDITVEKRMRRELEELNKNLEDKVIERTRDLEKANLELKKANELKGRFIANASHELRTPLHSIIGFADVLLQKGFGELNEKQNKYLNTILTSGKHLLHLVNNILDLAKIDAGKSQLSYQKFQIKAAFEEVEIVLKALADRKTIAIESQADAGVTEFTADKVKFKQILYNLLSNAIKFTPDGGRVGFSAARFVNDDKLPWAAKGQDLMKLTVWDTGPGIKAEDRERIFEEFEQLDSSKNTEGTGLGLSLTRKLIEIHGGRIEVGGDAGNGAVFTVYLPFISTDADASAPQPPLPPFFPFPAMKEVGALVLVVEDDMPTVELITIHLTQAGYRVEHAYDGLEAIRKARELKPFVITLDIMLPKKDGWEVLQALKADPETKDIPVIIHSIVENTELAFALGATDYLVKPLDQSSLVDKLKNIASDGRRKKRPTSVVLITGDNATAGHVSEAIKEDGVIFHHAMDELSGIDLCHAVRPNAILVDVVDPESGFGMIKNLKRNPAIYDIPLFVLTSRDLEEAERSAFTGNVVNILRKDTLSSGELVSHLNNLELLYPEKAGLMDGLTEVFNRRYLNIRLIQEISRSTRYNIPLVFLIIELDHFDNYLAKKGEYYGNLALKKTSELIKKNIRGADVLVRYDFKAFALILTNTFLEPGTALARRFQSIIQDYPFLHEDVQQGGRLTISIGAAEFKRQTPDGLIGHAESALLDARKKGGNKVEVFQTPALGE
ncbi:MAG: diguanylate cyclase [Deltaproteobacteria bacterium]|nr:diguanylate cyclase [Deltaproteobacteria bacterium]